MLRLAHLINGLDHFVQLGIATAVYMTGKFLEQDEKMYSKANSRNKIQTLLEYVVHKAWKWSQQRHVTDHLCLLQRQMYCFVELKIILDLYRVPFLVHKSVWKTTVSRVQFSSQRHFRSRISLWIGIKCTFGQSASGPKL